jgi:acetyl-CoA carboxylase biotin carboxyl carrier protein
MSDEPVDINLDELRELIKLLRESNVAEFELRKADYRLRIRHGTLVEPDHTSATPVNGQGKQAAPTLPAGVAPPAPEEEVEEGLHEVRSPMVGTFYRSSSPDADAFVEVGDVIKKNQVLCIIEAMKIMNEIESDLEGTVRKVHASNGQPVEFGEVLFSIKPS